MKIGILAVQGAFLEHKNILDILGVDNIYVKNSKDLENIDGLILPGGESTSMGKLLRDFKIKDVLISKIEEGLPVFGTCAGMILLAKRLKDDDTVHLGMMDILVKRNGYGRQLGSFRYKQFIEEIDRKIEMVFIRAPYIEEVGEKVKILAKVEDKIVAIREENMLAVSFHPELTNDYSIHQYFIKMIKESE